MKISYDYSLANVPIHLFGRIKFGEFIQNFKYVRILD